MSATKIELSAMQQRIMQCLFDEQANEGDSFMLLEDLVASVGGERDEFVDALESLEKADYTSIRNVAGSLLVHVNLPGQTPESDLFTALASSGKLGEV